MEQINEKNKLECDTEQKAEKDVPDLKELLIFYHTLQKEGLQVHSHLRLSASWWSSRDAIEKWRFIEAVSGRKILRAPAKLKHPHFSLVSIAMPLYRNLKTAFTAIWAGARPGQPINACIVVFRFIFFVTCLILLIKPSHSHPLLFLLFTRIVSYFLIYIAVSLILDLAYLLSISFVPVWFPVRMTSFLLCRRNYKETTCTLRGYTNYTVAIPYQESLLFFSFLPCYAFWSRPKSRQLRTYLWCLISSSKWRSN